MVTQLTWTATVCNSLHRGTVGETAYIEEQLVTAYIEGQFTTADIEAQFATQLT